MTPRLRPRERDYQTSHMPGIEKCDILTIVSTICADIMS